MKATQAAVAETLEQKARRMLDGGTAPAPMTQQAAARRLIARAVPKIDERERVLAELFAEPHGAKETKAYHDDLQRRRDRRARQKEAAK